MSRKSSSTRSLWLVLVAIIGIYVYYRIWYVPKLDNAVPEVVTFETLLQHPEHYQNRQVMLQTGVVSDPIFWLERSFFWVSDKNSPGSILGISPLYRPEGVKLDHSVFLFEIIFSNDGQSVLMLREVRPR